MNTSAVKSGDEYIINGVKTFITNGTIGNFVVLLCQTDPEAKPTYRGQSTILVETGTPGYTRTDVGEKMGIKMTSTGELAFNNVKVPRHQHRGNGEQGFLPGPRVLR